MQGSDPARSQLTPDAVWRRRTQRCFARRGYSRAHRYTSGHLKARVYREYGIPRGVHHYEMDHPVPLSLAARTSHQLWHIPRHASPHGPDFMIKIEAVAAT